MNGLWFVESMWENYPIEFNGKSAFSWNSNDMIKNKNDAEIGNNRMQFGFTIKTDEQWTLHFVYIVCVNFEC